MGLTKMDGIELGLIGAATAVTWFGATELAWQLSYGTVLCYSAVLLLGQGLVRDLVRIVIRKARGEPRADPGPKQRCLCAESSLGVLLIVLGSLALLSGISETVTLSQLSLSITVGAILLSGFLIKDYVISIKKEKDHANVLVGW